MLRIHSALTPAEWRRAGALAAAVICLNVLGWGTMVFAVAPQYPKVLGLGVGVLAFMLGLRHAFDADHIAAIDNTTRKFLNDGKRSLSVGFFFSLGHSTIVFGLGIAVATAARAAVGALVSGGFLYLIAAMNLVILIGILKIFRDMRHGLYDAGELERQLDARGLIVRFLRPLFRSVRSSWQMYPIGILFGLGFDTASEVALLALTAGAVGSGLPFYAILVLPVLFAAGMCLMDTLDGAFMAFAYDWAFSKPIRKIYYNIIITGLSVAVAFFVGTVELLQVLQGHFDLTGPFWTVVRAFDINTAGYVVVALFVVTWAAAVIIWKHRHIEQRWERNLVAEDLAELERTA
ncbi:MAG: HoxN/HupN/NixA family nickel/cobalt transporter [Chloroflexi bacterium]|nr:MAG: HoxN/HupN/NixA family nickel/cobalt transporter [Chloroflexota bacterium]